VPVCYQFRPFPRTHVYSSRLPSRAPARLS